MGKEAKNKQARSNAGSFIDEAGAEQAGLLREFLYFLMHNKKWWLTPIIIVLLLLALLIVLGGSAAAPSSTRWPEISASSGSGGNGCPGVSVCRRAA